MNISNRNNMRMSHSIFAFNQIVCAINKLLQLQTESVCAQVSKTAVSPFTFRFVSQVKHKIKKKIKYFEQG